MTKVCKYYVYRHLKKNDGSVFYIGIGTRNENAKIFNSEYKRAFTYIGRNRFWNNVVSKNGFTPEIIFESNNKEEIKTKEREFIKLYGRIDIGTGCLVNLTDGGEVFYGLHGPMSLDTKIKISKSHSGRYFSDEHKQAIKIAAQNRKKPNPFSDEHRRKIGERSKAAVRNIEWRQSISNSLKGKVGVMRGKTHPLETKIKMSIASKGRPKSKVHALRMRISKLKVNEFKNLDKIILLTKELETQLQYGTQK